MNYDLKDVSIYVVNMETDKPIMIFFSYIAFLKGFNR